MEFDHQRRFIAQGALACALLLAFSAPLRAQGTATIQGHITDPGGGTVPRATVTATNQNTGVARRAQSADDGYYRIADLLPGMYDVRVETTGFKSAVRSGFTLTAEAVVGLDFRLELGQVTESVIVTAEQPQLETEVARISEVIHEREVRALPVQGRGILNLVMTSPGVVGKAERDAFCCDSFSNFAAPGVSTGGTENKSHFSLDGLSLRYTEGSDWGALFSPNADAVAELRVSTNPYQAEFGRMSGPQIQLVTKSGTNAWHGTSHFTFQDKRLNATPFFADELPDSYTRFYGGTAGGPIKKNRLFVFGAFEGLRERVASSWVAVAETEAFRDLLVKTRPNSVAASLLKSFPPFRYPTRNLVDVGSPGPDGKWTDIPDGIDDMGEVVVDEPNRRTGKQFNGRMDYHSASGKDRIFGSYWYTRPDWVSPGPREAFQGNLNTRVNSGSLVHTRGFSAQALNEVRLGVTHTFYQSEHSGAYHVPGIWTDDGLSLGNFGWSREHFVAKTLEIGDVISLNRGRHNLKIGANYRRGTTLANSLLPGSTPEYGFSSILDFANDEPYYEFRSVEVGTGKAASPRLLFVLNELAVFVQDSWQVTPNLTLNWGLRWENFFNNWLGEGRNNWQPVVKSSALAPPTVAAVENQGVNRYYGTDWNNFSPRFGIAWDPTGRRKISIRSGFGLLYDEIHTVHLYDLGNNPPAIGSGTAGPDYGIPIVYAAAPAGTRDFPANPGLTPQLDPSGGIVGSRVGLSGMLADLKIPLVLDTFGGVQYQLATDLMIELNYKRRRTTNDIYTTDFNRFSGDMLDGRMDRLNPSFDSIALRTNRGRRSYHGLILAVSKRFSRGWSLSGSYTYSNGKDNYGQQTDAHDPSLDWGRNDIAHVFTMHNVWELPILRGRTGWLAGAFGGWQLSTVWNLQSGGIFTPVTGARFGQGGDFNADGRRSDRPDRPTAALPSSFTKQQWLAGAMEPSVFPLPDPSTIRVGTLPRDLFRRPGYARIDVALHKEFPIGAAAEGRRLQLRAESFNVANRLNISSVQSRLDATNFARATNAYQNRVVQMAVKFLF